MTPLMDLANELIELQKIADAGGPMAALAAAQVTTIANEITTRVIWQVICWEQQSTSPRPRRRRASPATRGDRSKSRKPATRASDKP